MADDADTEWAAPFWAYGAEPAHRGAMVWVLNAGSAPAQVTVTWHRYNGPVAHKSAETIKPGTTSIFVSGQWDTVGWLRVSADEPVLPWGTTPASQYDDDYVHMSFFRSPPPPRRKTVRPKPSP